MTGRPRLHLDDLCASYRVTLIVSSVVLFSFNKFLATRDAGPFEARLIPIHSRSWRPRTVHPLMMAASYQGIRTPGSDREATVRAVPKGSPWPGRSARSRSASTAAAIPAPLVLSAWRGKGRGTRRAGPACWSVTPDRAAERRRNRLPSRSLRSGVMTVMSLSYRERDLAACAVSSLPSINPSSRSTGP